MNEALDGIAVAILIIVAAIFITGWLLISIDAIKAIRRTGIRQTLREHGPYLITLLVTLAVVMFLNWRLG